MWKHALGHDVVEGRALLGRPARDSTLKNNHQVGRMKSMGEVQRGAVTVNGNKNDDKEKKSSGGLNVVYLSDISRMLPTTEAYIMQRLAQTDVLILDSLLVDREHPVHYSLKQAIELARRLKAKKTYIVGINCDDFLPHDEANEELKKVEGLDVELAYDGLVIEA